MTSGPPDRASQSGSWQSGSWPSGPPVSGPPAHGGPPTQGAAPYATGAFPPVGGPAHGGGYGGPAGPPPYGGPPAPTHRAGAVTTVAGSAVVVLSFLFLPYVSFFVSLTAPQTIRYLTRLGQTNWQLVWLVPVLATAAGAVALIHLLRGRPGRAGAATTAGLTGAVVLAYVVNLMYLASQGPESGFGVSVVDYLGSGFWLGLLGAVAACVGAFLDVAAARRGSARAGGPA